MQPSALELLRSRLRLGGWEPENDPDKRLPRFVLATNPVGGPARQWIQERFVDPSPTGLSVFADKSTEIPDAGFPGLSSIYIPARISDNIYIDQIAYPAQLMGLEKSLREALLHGSWDCILGAAVHNLSKEKHMISNKFHSEENRGLWGHWLHFTSMDWGVAAPYYIGIFCVVDVGFELKDSKTGKTIYIPESSVILFDELAGHTEGSLNTGVRLPAPAVARKVLEKEKELGISSDYRVCDYAAWTSTDGGPSVAHQMARNGLQQRQAKKNREAGYHEVLARLSGNALLRSEGDDERHPRLFICSNCEYFWKTVPNLTLDVNRPDSGPQKKNAPDHAYDALYMALLSQPYAITVDERERRDADSFREAYLEARQDMGVAPVDPYWTG